MKFKKYLTINETVFVCIALSIIGVIFLGLHYKKVANDSLDISCSDEVIAKWWFEKPFTTFEQYPSKEIFTGTTALLDLNSSFIARRFRTTINDALKRGVNFAGHYVIAEWGFTGIGGEIAVVDIKTGKAYPVPYVADMGFEYRKDSNLLVMNPLWLIKKIAKETGCANPAGRDFEIIRPYYFLWEDNSFRLLHPLDIPPPLYNRVENLNP